MVTRIGSFANQQLILNAALRTQALLSESQIQAATGKKSQTFSGISEDTSRLVNLKNELAKSQQFVTGIDTVKKRLSLMNFGLEQIDKAAREMRSLLRSAINGDAADTINLQQLSQQFLDQVVELLNLRDDSRFLFSGGKTDSKPVDLANGAYTAPTPPPFDPTADTGYYEGDSKIQEIRIDDGVVVQYGILAAEPAFEKVIRALDNIARTTFSSPIAAAEQQVVNDAIALLTEATENNGTDKTVGELAANVALDMRLLESQKNKHNEFINFAIESIGDIENVDRAEAISTLNFQRVQLEASFRIIARIGSLTLNDFLR